MPYTLIEGTVHLTGISQSGNPTSFQPDGDSIQFRPDNINLLDRLERFGRPPRPTNLGSVNLRLEGIDATENALRR